MKEQFKDPKSPQEYRDNLAKEIKNQPKEEREKFLSNKLYKVSGHSENEADYISTQLFHNIAREKITSGETENLNEANILVSRNLSENILKTIESGNQWLIDIPHEMRYMLKKNYSKQYDLANKNKKYYHVISDGLDSCGEEGFYYDKLIGLSLAHLPFDEAKKYTEELISKTKNYENGEMRGFYVKDFHKNILKAFLNLQCKDKEKLESFINSEMAENIEPEAFFRQAGENNMGIAVIKSLIEKYGVNDLSKLSLFDEGGLLNKLETKEKKKILVEVMNSIEMKVDEYLKNIEQKNTETRKGWYDSHSLKYPDLNDGCVHERLAHLKSSLKEGILLPDYKERLAKIENIINLSSKHPSANYAGVKYERDEVNTLLRQLGQEMDLQNGEKINIKGEGPEIENNNLFFDGKFISYLESASFGENWTNGEVVSWKRTERLDHEPVLGIQVRLSIYGYKKGDKNPSELYDDNYWSAGKYINVSNPEVSADGIITFTVEKEDGKKQTITKTV